MKNTLYQAFVILKGFRFYAILNIICLVLCLSCVISISMYLYRESTVNEFITKKDRIFTVVNNNYQKMNYSTLDCSYNDISFNYGSIPDIQATTKVANMKGTSVACNEDEYVVNMMMTDSAFFHIFDIPLFIGDPQTVFRDPHSIVITKALAVKMFGEKNPLGKTISWSGHDFTIKGICELPIQKSSFIFDAIVPAYDIDWAGSKCRFQFFLLDNPDKVKSVEQKLYLQYSESESFRETDKVFLEPFNEFDRFSLSNYIFYLIPAVLIFIIGIVNFAGCYYIMTLHRGKELGIKKIFGAERISVYWQFFIECFIIVLISIILAFSLIESLKPYLLEYFSMEIEYLWGFILILILFILIVLPALMALLPYRRFRQAPNDNIKNINMIGKTNARIVFVTVQVIITMILIICTLFFSKQLLTLLNTETGIDTENVIVVGRLGHDILYPRQNDFLQKISEANKNAKALVEKKLAESPFILKWVIGGKIFNCSESSYKFRAKPEDPFIPLLFRGHYDCQSLDFYGVKLLEGYLPDATENDMHHVVITESAKKLLGINDITAEQIEISESCWGEDIHYQVVGVIKDVLVDQIPYGNKAIIFNSDVYPYITDGFSVRYQEGKEKETIALLQEIFNELHKEVDYHTLKEEHESLYESNRNVTMLFLIFTLITIIVSAIGLFALSYYDIRRRYREIALRKINGATANDIVKLLIKKYLLMLAIASAIAIPVSIYIIRMFMENLNIPSAIPLWIFVLAEIITILIVIGTLLRQTVHAVSENPVEAMKVE